MKAYIHLDKDFQPFKKSLQYEHFTFSGGELHIRITDNLSEITKVIITTRPRSFNDLGLLLLASDALRQSGIKHLELLIPYFPAARQDRLMVKGEALSVKVYANLINSINFEKVTIFDPHSDVTSALINNVDVISNHKFVEQVTSNFTDFHLISPDVGALKKVYKLAQKLPCLGVIECSKSRDVKTGKLLNFNVYEEDLQGKDCIIVDDICDGGGTFLGLADELKKKNAGRLFLVVSHGIFSKGVTILKDKFDRIYTTNSFQNINMPEVTCIELSTVLS